MVRFNGIDDDGHETLYIQRVDKPQSWASDKTVVFGFCKTARKPYDVYVTATLLLAHVYLGDEIKISSDGEVEDWQAGVKLLDSKLGLKITLEENPEAEYPTSIDTALLTFDEVA